MSYANVAAHNAPPPSQQPKPDAALLNTVPPTSSNVADDASKVNVVGPSFNEDPATVTSEAKAPARAADLDYEDERDNVNGSEKRKRRKEKVRDTENKAVSCFEVAKERLLQPGVAGGLLGVVNVGIIGYACHAFYSNPSLRRDRRFITIGSVSLFTLLGLEGYVSECYAQTPRGKEERKRAREEGAALYRHAHKVMLRPGVLGGLLGFVNVGILGGVGFVAWKNWEKPTWDRRIVCAVGVGMLGLWSAEGVLAEKYSSESQDRE